MKTQIHNFGDNTSDYARREASTQSQVSFPGMVRGELMKMTWLRSTWIMLALVMSGTALVWLFNLANHNVHNLLLSDPVGYAYQYVLSQNLLVFRALSGFFALLVTAFVFGLEYQQGTIRVILGRGVGRVKFLCSKIVALFLMAVLVQLGGIILNGILMVAVIGNGTGSFAAVGVILSQCMGTFLLFFLYLIFNMWISILLATAVTVLGRSLAFGMSVALLWFPVDNFAATLCALLRNQLPGNLAITIGNLLLGPDLNVLPTVVISPRIGSTPLVTISEWQAIAVVLIYALVFLAAAIALIRSRDVH